LRHFTENYSLLVESYSIRIKNDNVPWNVVHCSEKNVYFWKKVVHLRRKVAIIYTNVFIFIQKL